MRKSYKFSLKDNHPVDSITWEEAVEFCQTLSTKTNTTVCLPSEAQWEYCCRANTTTKYYFGEQDEKLIEYGWYGEKYDTGSTHPVGMKTPNPWELFDMHGNVWEWCQDEWHNNYQGAPDDGSSWESTNSNINLRVARGGSWVSLSTSCESASRERFPPKLRDPSLGFRVIVKE